MKKTYRIKKVGSLVIVDGEEIECDREEYAEAVFDQIVPLLRLKRQGREFRDRIRLLAYTTLENCRTRDAIRSVEQLVRGRDDE